MIPALMTFVQGQAVTSADNLNTLVQQCNTFADLRSFTGLTNMLVFCKGGSAINDGLGGSFYWNATAVGTDNNSTFIVPTGSLIGAWILVPTQGSGGGGIPITTADNLTAFAGGGQGSATQVTTNWARFTTAANPLSSANMRSALVRDYFVVLNDTVNTIQLFSNDVINGFAGSVGVTLPAASIMLGYCLTNGAWRGGLLWM
jgi:hypothetical protein